jgi:hypothetical protein
MSRADMLKITHAHPAKLIMEQGGTPSNCEAVLISFLHYAAVHQVEHLIDQPLPANKQRVTHTDKSLRNLLLTRAEEQPDQEANQLKLDLAHTNHLANNEYESLPSEHQQATSLSGIPTPQQRIWPWGHPGRPTKPWEEPTPALLIDSECLPDLPRLYFWNYACASCIHQPQLLADLELGDVYGLSLRILEFSKKQGYGSTTTTLAYQRDHSILPEICQHFRQTGGCKYEQPSVGLWCKYSHGASRDKERTAAKKIYNSGRSKGQPASSTQNHRAGQPVGGRRRQATPTLRHHPYAKAKKVSDEHKAKRDDCTGEPGDKLSDQNAQVRAPLGLLGDIKKPETAKAISTDPAATVGTTHQETRDLLTNNNGVFEWNCSLDNAFSSPTPTSNSN